jgi:prohibitin 2
MNAGALRITGIAIILFALILAGSQSTYVVKPGFRGIRVTMGEVAPQFLKEGFGMKAPFVTRIVNVNVNVRQQTSELLANCYSSDLQQVKTQLKVLYRIPESSAVSIFQNYSGDPFLSLIAPRLHEALKEVTALQSAEQIVQNREIIKTKALELTRKKVGGILEINDLVVEDISLTKELETAIEQKMVQQQESAKAKYTQQKVEIEAQTAVIKARGDAEAIRIQGEALAKNPAFLELQIVDKWKGRTPRVLDPDVKGSQMVLPLQTTKREDK